MEPAQPWHTLPVRITKEDVVRVPLSKAEVASIVSYGNKYFNRRDIDKYQSQWLVTKGKTRNPNATGIRGEWAMCKFVARNTFDLKSFLAFRPWKMVDVGDAVFVGKTVKIFDYKTRTRNVSLQKLVEDDTYMAEMDAKFADRKKYGYLEAFVFCANHEETNEVYLLGWITAEEYFENVQLVKGGKRLPRGGSYFNDCVMIPYRRLRPVAELQNLTYAPITEPVTIDLKQVWQQKGLEGIHAYFTAHLS